MRRLATILATLIVVTLSAGQTFGAGADGHLLFAQKTIQNIKSGAYKAPDFLKTILQFPDARRAFCGGAVAPDICEGKSHYGNTATLAQQMLVDAGTELTAAAKAKDEAAFAKARNEIAFVYGWLTHCAVDLNVHPQINETAGDTYRDCTTAEKAIHAAQEAQLTAYLKSVVGKSAEPFDVAIPYDFLSKHVGVSVEDLRKGETIVRGKVMAELFAASKVTLTDQMRNTWSPTIKGAVADTLDFVNDPTHMHNWDLDSGKLSSEEFDNLRRLVMQANGGKLPKDWGKRYMWYYQQCKGLSGERMMAKLLQMFGKSTSTAVSFAGTWKSTFGALTLSVSGTSFSGTYPHNSGRVEGTLSADGRTAKGKWYEHANQNTYDGEFTWGLASDGKSFTGSWWGSIGQGPWNGTRE